MGQLQLSFSFCHLCNVLLNEMLNMLFNTVICLYAPLLFTYIDVEYVGFSFPCIMHLNVIFWQ